MGSRAKVFKDTLRTDHARLCGRIDEAMRSSVEETLSALLLRDERHRRLKAREFRLEWTQVLRDLDEPQEIEFRVPKKSHVPRTDTKGATEKIFQICGVDIPLTSPRA